MSKDYFLHTGEIDKQRLTILNKVYNPSAISFLKDSGLKPGMTILEVGCGTGHMACDLAAYLGPEGKVIATDSSKEQIEIAKQVAKAKNIKNIDFHICNVFDLNDLTLNYDATYGRWVVEFTPQPEKALEVVYQNLNKGGLLVYEASNMEQTSYFSFPYQAIIEKWHSNATKMFTSFNYPLKFGYEAYSVFKKLGCHDIQTRVNQGILTTPEEKSVYRLGLITGKSTYLQKNIATEQEIEKLMEDFSVFEQSDAISGFYHNILVSGVK